MCLNYSRATVKKGRGLRALPHKSNGGGVSKMELSKMLSKFKQDIIKDVATQLATMQGKRKMNLMQCLHNIVYLLGKRKRISIASLLQA